MHAAFRVVCAQREAAVPRAAALTSGWTQERTGAAAQRGPGQGQQRARGGADVGAQVRLCEAWGWQHTRGGRAGWGSRSGPRGGGPGDAASPRGSNRCFIPSGLVYASAKGGQ